MFRVLISLILLIDGGICGYNRTKFTIQPFYSIHGTMCGLIGLGTPTQPTAMELTIASPDFFVIPSDCKTYGCTMNRKGYQTSQSTTFKEITPKIPFSTEYLGTKSTGRLAQDALTALAIPGVAPPEIIVPLIDQPNGALTYDYATGLMGWGFLPAESPLPGTFLQTMLQALDAPVWEVYLQSYNHSLFDDVKTSGSVTYGAKDIDNCEEEHIFLKTDNPNAWEINMDYARIGDIKLTGGSALFYPGSPRIHGPEKAVSMIIRRINADWDDALQEFVVDCKLINKLPMLSFVFHTRVFTYYPREYLVQSEGTQKCVLMINDPSERFKGADWILGAPLLREHCWMFDFNGPQIGFSNHKSNQTFR